MRKEKKPEETVSASERIAPFVSGVTLPVGLSASDEKWRQRVQSAIDNNAAREQLEASSGGAPTTPADYSVAKGVAAEMVFQQRRDAWRLKRWHVSAGLGVAALLATGVYFLSQPAEAEQLPPAPVSTQEDPGFLGDISGITEFADALGGENNNPKVSK